MNILCLILSFLLNIPSVFASEEITPYKYTDGPMPEYQIPQGSRFTTERLTANAPDLVYYYSAPKTAFFPIAILVGGSTNKDDINSIIHFHRYFLQEFQDLNVGVITIEQWGVDGNQINQRAFVEHYTRSQRLDDHQALIHHLKANPPTGWNGQLIFLGVSEGGPIVTTLTEKNADITMATMNWSGADAWTWRDNLWVFLQQLAKENPECPHGHELKACPICMSYVNSREHYNQQMDTMLQNPTTSLDFFGMTYKYHADTELYPKPHYRKITTPFLVVAGAIDPNIESSDLFVKKAEKAHVNITYTRVPDMDHYIRKRPDIVKESFEWLKQRINNA